MSRRGAASRTVWAGLSGAHHGPLPMGASVGAQAESFETPECGACSRCFETEVTQVSCGIPHSGKRLLFLVVRLTFGAESSDEKVMRCLDINHVSVCVLEMWAD